MGSRAQDRPSRDVSELFEPYVWAWFADVFGQPSPPQAASWPKIAEGKNTLIFSPTGSGKTLAAFLWCINELFRMGSQQQLDDSVYVLYVSPLKALNNDIQKNLIRPLRGIKVHARRMGIDVPEVRSAVRTGDTTQRQRAAMARRPPHILITTPESLFIILSTAKFRNALRTVRYVIVDEIHAMSDNKRGVHLSLSLERLEHLVGEDREDEQPEEGESTGNGGFLRIGLSATQKPLDEISRFLAGVNDRGRYRPCEIVDTGGRKDLNVRVISPVDNLSEAHYDAVWGSMYDKMLSMVREHATTLIFANSRYKTERTALRLNELSAESPVRVGAHHGSMSKTVRLDMENRLKEGELDALVATSSLELGIDVGSIDLVCQIQSPKSLSRGLQRIGRAGHLLNTTSEGRLLVADRDDLVESAVLVRAIMDGHIDTTRVPKNCLDVLAQHVVGAVAADPWSADALFDLCRCSYCYKDLKREHYERVLHMLAAHDDLDMERSPYPKVNWDRVNNVLYPERSARLIAFRASGTIPDVEDYDVYFEKRKTKVGQLDEGFVERLRVGDIFILGSSSWRVVGFQRNRVIVEDVYGRAPTIPYWGGDRDSRTYDLGLLVGRFRSEMQAQRTGRDPTSWLQREYYVGADGARAIAEYFWEQQSVTGELASDRLVLVERFRDELGLQQIVIHSSFGVRVNDAWAMALSRAIQERYGFRPQTATVDDGILITVPQDAGVELDAPLDLVTLDNVDELLRHAVLESPLFASRFRHNAVRSLMVLREYRGRGTPVWLQSLRASALLEACRDDAEFPLMVETYRECMNESLDVPNLRQVLQRLAFGEIDVATVEARVPSPFTHSLLLLGQYGDAGTIPTRERRSRLMHLHRELLRQILDAETLRNLLDRAAVEDVEERLQCTNPHRRARDANELARILVDLGDQVQVPDDEISLISRVDVELDPMLDQLVSTRRAVRVPIPTAEMHTERWIATENLALYRAAFATLIQLDDTEEQILDVLSRDGPLTLAEIPLPGRLESHLQRLVRAYLVLQVPCGEQVAYAATKEWVPARILKSEVSRQEARLALVYKFLRSHGPVTKYEVMERYGFPERWVEEALDVLTEEGNVVRGEYVPHKSLPQWCYKPNLEQIHSLTLQRLRKEMEPATPEEYASFLLHWQHRHPDVQLRGPDGLREVIRQIQGQENYQILYERDVFPGRVMDYEPSMLDRLCCSGEVIWRRFDPRHLKRGQIGFCFRRDQGWVVPDPDEVDIEFHHRWEDDIPQVNVAVRGYLREHGACFFDDIVEGTGLDWRLVLRSVWHLVWTGEVTNDCYESIRYADIASGLSACYDLATHPGKKGVTIEMIVRHMLENRRLDPRLGRWAPTERLVPDAVERDDADQVTALWADQLLRRHGVVTKDVLRNEVSSPGWKDIRRALAKLELLGQVRRGFFVEGLSGEQYAFADAVEALHDAKLRQTYPDSDGNTGADDLILVNMLDPANPFGFFFPITDQAGEQVKVMRTPTKYLVLQDGCPVILYEGRISVLRDLTRHAAEAAIRLLMGLIDHRASIDSRQEIAIREWNSHPIDVSPARHLLLTLGFVQVSNRWRGYVYDGNAMPDVSIVAAAEKEIPEIFEYAGKEKAPVVYDAEWVISRSEEVIRPKVRELIRWLQARLPPECEFVYRPRYVGDFQILYRGMRCINPHIQRKQVWLRITHVGWTQGILIQPDTDLDGPDFVNLFTARFERTRKAIDALLDQKRSLRHGD